MRRAAIAVPARTRGGSARLARGDAGRGAAPGEGSRGRLAAGVSPGRADAGGASRNGGVGDFQRARMIAALVAVAAERGSAQLTVAHIVARSGVSRRTFYEHFEDRETCFLAAFEEAVRRGAKRVLPAFAAGGDRRARVRGGQAALLEFLDDEPGLGRLCVVEALGAGTAALECRERVVEVLIDVADEGRALARGSASPTRLTAEGVVGAVLAVLHARLADRASSSAGHRRDGSQLSSLLGPLMGIVVLPYLGPAAAARESSRTAPERRRVERPQEDPLRELEMRLTYRTVRVLLAIADEAGASNRRVADAAGVADQGQISKLLTRLEHLGLIANRSGGHSRGEPNAWSLTPRGQEIEYAIRQQAAIA
jgi:AcrR family transcriptional regulator